MRLFLYQFLLLGAVAALLGCLLGYVTQALLVGFIESMRDTELPQPSVLPAIKSAASGFALLFGFAFLPLLQLRKVSPLRVLRRELGAPQANTWLAYGLAVLVLAILFLWHSGSAKLGFTMLGGLLAGLAVFGLLAWLLLRGLYRISQRDWHFDRGRERLSPSPPSEPCVRFSRTRLSRLWFPHRGWLADIRASVMVNSPNAAK